jgi:hypothetical protein
MTTRRVCNLKYRQHNGQKKKDKQHNLSIEFY